MSSVLSHCQVNQIPAVAYQCYSDAISPDSITMDTYKLAFTSVGDIKVSFPFLQHAYGAFKLLVGIHFILCKMFVCAVRN